MAGGSSGFWDVGVRARLPVAAVGRAHSRHRRSRAALGLDPGHRVLEHVTGLNGVTFRVAGDRVRADPPNERGVLGCLLARSVLWEGEAELFARQQDQGT